MTEPVNTFTGTAVSRTHETMSQFLKGKRVALIGPGESIEGVSRGEFVDSHDVVVRMIRPGSEGGRIPTGVDMEIVPKRLEKNIGSAAHVVYSNFEGVRLNDNYLNYLVECGVKYFNCTRPAEDDNNSFNHCEPLLKKAGLLSCVPSISKYEEWRDKLKASPCSGFGMLLDLLSYDIKELYILGYSFYKEICVKEWLTHNNVTIEQTRGFAAKGVKEMAFVSESSDIKKWKREVNSLGQQVHNFEKERIYLKKEILAKDPRVKVDISMTKFLDEHYRNPFIEAVRGQEKFINDKLTKKTLPKNKVFCFDIDGVIASITPNAEYGTATPVEENIKIINKLFDNENKIMLFTARGSETGIDWRETTEKQMKEWGVKYNELKFGKPFADYYIDDKMLSLNDLSIFDL
tara:strand:- start:4002 stop:5213 length:1212 start_codon:yes stop_codon:yes gene_type:complete